MRNGCRTDGHFLSVEVSHVASPPHAFPVLVETHGRNQRHSVICFVLEDLLLYINEMLWIVVLSDNMRGTCASFGDRACQS